MIITKPLTVARERDPYGVLITFVGGPLRLPHRFRVTYTVTAPYAWILRQPGVAHLSYADFLAILPEEGADPVEIPLLVPVAA